MAGGVMQLVCYGAQDIYLTGNPQITFFKIVYKRHTNFSIEAIEIPCENNSPNLGSSVTINIPRSGDLLSAIILEIDWDSSGVAASWRIGHQIIDYVELYIGGQLIDKHYGVWMDIWAQLTHTDENMEKLSRILNGQLKNKSNNSKTYTPLQFWFCNNPGLALPLIALQYHEVKIKVKFNDYYVYADPNNTQQYIYSNNLSPKIYNLAFFADYIFLDVDERRCFSKMPHEYLIEQVQFSNKFSLNPDINQVKMLFNHPIKEIIWAIQRDNTSHVIHPFDFWGVNSDDYTVDLVKSAKIQLNMIDRFKEREGTYFRCIQPYQYHTGGNKQVGYISPLPPLYYDYLVEPFGGFYIYSFALKPEQHQPSGTCNFSRIDNAVLLLNVNSQSKNLQIWARNYNILRIMSGMGGLAYSN